MPESYALNHYVEDISPTEFIDRLPAYDSYAPNFARLDQIRQIIESYNYAPYTVAFPFGSTAGLSFSAFATKEGSLQIPVGSFLLGITGIGISSVSDFTTIAPFRFAITDKGSGLGIAERSYVFNSLQAGNSAQPGPLDADGYLTKYMGGSALCGANVFWLDAPFVITAPGQVQIAITNLSSLSIVAQMAFHFAMLINNVSVNTPVIRPA